MMGRWTEAGRCQAGLVGGGGYFWYFGDFLSSLCHIIPGITILFFLAPGGVIFFDKAPRGVFHFFDHHATSGHLAWCFILTL